MTRKDLIEKLRAELPPMWDRKNTTELTGGLVNHRTLANLMSLGKGPKGTIRMGHKKVGIIRDPFLDWFDERFEFDEFFEE